MSEHDKWQRAVWIDPARVETPSPKSEATRERPAQEFPLDQVETLSDQQVDIPEVAAPKRRGRWRRLLGLSVVSVLTLGVGSELYRLLDWSFSLHPAVGTMVSGLLLLLLLSGGVQLWKSVRGLRQLRQTEALREQAQRLLEHQGQGQAAAFLKQLEQHYSGASSHQDLIDAMQQLDSTYSDSEVVRYLSQHCLQHQDARAKRCVQRYSVESGVLVALSPWASFDMLLVGWRNLRMLREIADIYGIAPGAAAQWVLLKHVLHSLAFAGLSEMAIDAGTAALGSSLTANLSARAGQGLGAGLFTARTGLQALRLCRPLPMAPSDQKLTHTIAKGIVERLSGVKTGS